MSKSRRTTRAQTKAATDTGEAANTGTHEARVRGAQVNASGQTEVIVIGRPVDQGPVADDTPEDEPIDDPTPQSTPRTIVESGGKTTVLQEEDPATAAAGPHRPTPARQIFHHPPGSLAVPLTADGTRAAAHANIKVMAKQDGYIYEARRRAGDVFTLTDEAHFSKKWMVRVSANTPEKTSTGRDVLKRQHDDIVGARLAGDESRAGRSARHVVED